jgi:transposase-like protein
MLSKTSAYGHQTGAGPGPQIARELARWWLEQAKINAGTQAGTSSLEQAEITQLQAEINRLRGDNEILKAATILFARELDPRHR